MTMKSRNRRMAMPAKTEDVMAVRREIWNLLRQQLETLNSPDGLNDDQLLSCYYKQTRVQELREKLEVASNAESKPDSNLNDSNAADPTVHETPAANAPSSRSQVERVDSLTIAA
jgi:hypothetical protein